MFYIRVIAIFISYASQASILGKVKKNQELKLHEKHQNQTIYSLYLILWDKIISLPLKQTVLYDIKPHAAFYPVKPFYNECQGCNTFWNIEGSQINKITATAIIALNQNVLLLFYKFCFAFLRGLRPPQSNCTL